MAWNKAADFPALHASLASVMPEYAPISSRVGDALGVYKAIDSRGTVWLVEFKEPLLDEKGKLIQRIARKRVFENISDAMPSGGRQRRRADLDL